MFDAEYVQKHKPLLLAVSVVFAIAIINLVVLVGYARTKTAQPRPTPTPVPRRRVSAPAWEVEQGPGYYPSTQTAPQSKRSQSFVPLFFQPRNPQTGEVIGYTNPFEFIENLIFVAMAAGMITAFFVLLKGAYLYMTSEGDQQKMEKAKKTITMALVGVGIIALSSAILSAAGVLFGLNFFNLSGVIIPGPGNTLY